MKIKAPILLSMLAACHIPSQAEPSLALLKECGSIVLAVGAKIPGVIWYGIKRPYWYIPAFMLLDKAAGALDVALGTENKNHSGTTEKTLNAIKNKKFRKFVAVTTAAALGAASAFCFYRTFIPKQTIAGHSSFPL